MEYDVDYFIKKFEAIPRENWCKGTLQRKVHSLSEDIVQHCVLGHCGVMFNHDSIYFTPEAIQLANILDTQVGDLFLINDQKGIPKDNVLNELYKVKDKLNEKEIG